MTYCVAMRLKEGLIFVSDSRTNAGMDHIATFRKLHRFGVPGERMIVIQSSGNLATSQAVVTKLFHSIQADIGTHLNNVSTIFDAAGLVGQYLTSIMKSSASVLAGTDELEFSSSILLGGQIKGQPTELYSIYPQGNFIAATSDTPYFQIGESKYGKPILDRALSYDSPLDKALRCALISFDSTIRSNLSVGTPLDLVVYKNDSFDFPEGRRLTENDPYFSMIRQQWSDSMRSALAALPPPPDDYWR
ncbi:proteasome-type protease [Aquirhabdus parva]|uniref:Peptidase n=1 Tax=Aquirhabdus parva TaxID=2283318 RepID=A0A345P6X5_9GAMM|nr:proteasome-type protease [Aquirhabdus parva]AXI03034.1 peptidase [Aquirhabdus parva]